MKKDTTSGPGSKTKAQLIKEQIEKNQITKGEPGPAPTGPPPVTKKVKKVKKAKAATADKPGKKPEQLGLPGVKVKLDKVGKAANRFRKSLEELEAAQDEKGAASEGLIKAMKKAKRLRISVEGYDFQILHQGPKDGIKVTKPK